MHPDVSLTLKRVAVFLGLLLLGFSLLAALLIAYFRCGVFHFGLVDSNARAAAWVDENGDGQRDAGEPPLEGVCVWADTGPSQYDEQWLAQKCAADYGYGLSGASGQWPAERSWPFFAGASCSDVYIYAVPPPGYQATTALVVNDCQADFGFAPRGVAPRVSSPSPQQLVPQLQWRRALTGVLRLVALVAIPLLTVAGALFAAKRMVRK